MDGNGKWDGYNDIITKEATEMWIKMKPQIKKLASKALPAASRAYEEEDFIYGLSWIACREGILRFRKFRENIKKLDGNIPTLKQIKQMKESMIKETYVYWYLQKFFFKETCKEIVYIIVSPSGELESYTTREFYRKFNKEKRSELEKMGYKIITDRIFKNFSDFKDDETDKDIEVIDMPDDFEEWKIKGNGNRSIGW